MSDVQQPVLAAALGWGVKESFRGYVEAMGGTISLSGPVERGADGGFVFSPEAGAALTLGADGRPEGQARFCGEVRFDAHGGMLKVSVADPAVEIDAASANLTVADPWAPGRRMAIAKLELAAAVADGGVLVIPAAATLDGMQLLGDHYPPGTALDPVRLRLAER